MHELSIVMSIVDLAEQTAKKNDANSIERIDLEIGKLAGIQMDALHFAWDSGVRESVLENAERVIHTIPGKGICEDCGIQFEMENIYDECPKCGSYFNKIISGKELRVKSLIIN